MNPTQEQIKELWEWCGWSSNGAYWFSPFPNEHSAKNLPSIDLNNLFKYAVPKLDYPNMLLYYVVNVKEWYCVLRMASHPWEIGEFSETPALALFWAIYKVMK